MWMIHDLLAYGLVVGCVHQGYKACPICGLDLTSWHLLELGKVAYEGSWCWLPRGHPYQRNQNLAHFNGKEEHRSKPRPIMASDTLKSVVEYEGWLIAGNTPRSKGNLSKVSGIIHRNAMYDLPDFEVCKLHSTVLPKVECLLLTLEFQYVISTYMANYQWMHCRI